MGKEYVFIKNKKKLFLGNFRMGKHKEWVNFIIRLEIIIWDSLNQIKKVEEEFIDGMVNSLLFIKGNLNQEDEMGEEHFGGQMAQSMLEILYRVSKLAMAHYIELRIIFNMKGIG